MWILQLNDMRSANVENIIPIFRAESEGELSKFMGDEAVIPYRDDKWWKSFRAGGPLEWYNPPSGKHLFDVGTEQDWIDDAVQSYEQEVMSVVEVSNLAICPAT